MHFGVRRFAMVALAAMAASPVVASDGLEYASSPFVQTWQFHERADGPGSCSVTLLMDGAAMASDDCAGRYPVLADLAGWRPLSDSALELRKAAGPLLRFSTVSPDALEAKAGGRTQFRGIEVVSYEQDFSDGAATLGGAYTLSAPDAGAGSCALVLEATGSDGRFNVSRGQGCAAGFPFLEGVSGWQPVGTEVIRLVGADGAALVEFGFTGDGVTFDATAPLDGVSYRLVRPGDGEQSAALA